MFSVVSVSPLGELDWFKLIHLRTLASTSASPPWAPPGHVHVCSLGPHNTGPTTPALMTA